MTRSGPQKPVRQSINGSGQPRGVMENVGACCCGHCPWARGPRRVPPDGGLSGGHLQLVLEVVQGWDAFFQAFALAHLRHHLTGAAGVVKRVTRQDLPVVKHTLGEGLVTYVGPQVSSEAEGLIDRKVGLHNKHRGAGHLGLRKDVTPLPVQDTVDATNHLFWTLDLHKIDGLHEPGLDSQHTGIQAAPSHGDDLATPTVDSISVHCHIMDIKAHTPHVLLAQCPLLGGPLEASHHTILDLIEVLHTIGDVCADVGAVPSGPKNQILQASATSHSYFSAR